jgi:hypothetical protein
MTVSLPRAESGWANRLIQHCVNRADQKPSTNARSGFFWVYINDALQSDQYAIFWAFSKNLQDFLDRLNNK